MTMQRWLIAAAVTCVTAAACSGTPEGTTAQTAPRPQQAKPTDPMVTAGHIAAIDAAGLTGNQRAMQAHMQAMDKDMMRSMHLADPSRPIDHEAARAAVRPLQGVRASVWIDRKTLLRRHAGRRCQRAGRNGEDLERRGYVVAQLPVRMGERALLQNKRQVDALDPEVRKVLWTI